MSEQDPQDQPTTASQQDTDAPAVAQEQGAEDSQLTTPQADQPIASEAERQETAEVGPSGEQAEGYATAPSYPSNAEQQAQAEEREADREDATREHNERTGGGDVHEGELQAQRDEHNARTAGESDSSE